MSDWLARMRGTLYRLSLRRFGGRITIGPGLRIYKRLHIGGPGRVHIGRDCVIGGIEGDRSQYVTLDTRHPTASIDIGDGARLYAARMAARYAITVGDGVLIEESGIMDTAFHSLDRGRGEPEDESLERCRVVIGDRVAVGARSLITRGVTVGERAVVCPASVVSRSVPEGRVVFGNPARPENHS